MFGRVVKDDSFEQAVGFALAQHIHKYFRKMDVEIIQHQMDCLGLSIAGVQQMLNKFYARPLCSVGR